VARKGDSEKAVQNETKSFTISMPDNMIDLINNMIQVRKTYSNRADYIMHAVRCFNDQTVKEIEDEIGTIRNNSRGEATTEELNLFRKHLSEKSKSYYRLWTYYGTMKEDSSATISFRIPIGMITYIQNLNQIAWNYRSVQTYVRVAVAWYIEKDRNGLGNDLKVRDFLTKEYTYSRFGK